MLKNVTVTQLLIGAAVVGAGWYFWNNKQVATVPVEDDDFDLFDWDSYRLEIEEGVDSLTSFLDDAWQNLNEMAGLDTELPISP